MRLAAPVELFIGIAHRFGTAAPEHDLHVDRFEAVVLEAVDDPGRAGDAFPWAQLAADPPPVFVLEEDRQTALQHEEDLLDLVRVRGIALPRRHIDDAEGEAACRDRVRVIVLAGTAGADEAVLRPAVTLDLSVLEGLPIGLLVAKPSDVAPRDILERQRGDFGRHLMASFGHRTPPIFRRHYTRSSCEKAWPAGAFAPQP